MCRILAAASFPIQDAARVHIFVAQHHIFGHCKYRHQHEMLVYHTHAGSNGISGGMNYDWLPFDEYFS